MNVALLRPPAHLNFLQGKVFQWQNEARAAHNMVGWALERNQIAAAIRWQQYAQRAAALARALLTGEH